MHLLAKIKNTFILNIINTHNKNKLHRLSANLIWFQKYAGINIFKILPSSLMNLENTHTKKTIKKQSKVA